MSAIDEARKAEAAMTPGPWPVADLHEGDEAAPVWMGTEHGGWAARGPVHYSEDGDEPGSEAFDRAEADSRGAIAIRNAWPTAMAELDRLRGEVERLTGALTTISGIRDGIVGMQGFNFSEHAYPLVAALDGAGFKGAGYKIARANLGTLIEQRDRADAALAEARRVAEEAILLVSRAIDEPLDANAMESIGAKQGNLRARLAALPDAALTVGAALADPRVRDRTDGTEPCTGIAASWCHNCGDCICERDSDGEWEDHDPKCPLHGDKSRHGANDPASPFFVAPASAAPPAERKPCEGWVDGPGDSSVLHIFAEDWARVYRDASTLRVRWYIAGSEQDPKNDAYADDMRAAKLAAEDAADALLVEARRRLGRV